MNSIDDWLKNASPDVKLLNQAEEKTKQVSAKIEGLTTNDIGAIEFIVPMRITGKARPRLGKKVVMPKAYKNWIRAFRLYVPSEFWQMDRTLPLELDLIIIRALPKRTSKKKHAELYGTVCMAGADRDNALGSVMDALWHKKTGGDDKVVVMGKFSSVWGNTDKIAVFIKHLHPQHKPLNHQQFLYIDEQ